MYKNIALIALLLPFSGAAQTKQEFKQQLENKYHDLSFEFLIDWIGILMSLPCIQNSLAMNPNKIQEIKNKYEEFRQQTEQLDKELESEQA